jgi:cytochrome c oxidase assembly protein subunit 15
MGPAYRPSPALHRFALFAAAATFVLVFAGGLVTSTGSPLAVPDWPLAFGRSVPKAIVGGVRFEYGHRVVAGFVVILTLILALWTRLAERRRWVRRLAASAAGLIVVQAVLGGLTVLLDLPLAMAVAHAATAQAFFCLMVALELVTNPDWEVLASRRADFAHPSLKTLTALTTAAIYGQILIGAMMRHMGAGLAIPDFPLSFGRLVPPLSSPAVAVNFAHRSGALVVSVLIFWTAVRVIGRHREEPLLVRPAVGLLALLALQVTIGALTVLGGRAVLATTAHVAVGAAVLATSLALAVRARHLTGLVRAAEPSAGEAELCEARAAGDRLTA